jgi:hypothetical protein
MPAARGIDVDTIEDLEYAQFVLEHMPQVAPA